MMPEELEALMHDVERWAQGERERLVYGGTRPVSICSTVEAATREAAIARGNAIAHSAEISEIESVSAHASQCLDALKRFIGKDDREFVA
jgi:bacterioferritin-associated ferredoxin